MPGGSYSRDRFDDSPLPEIALIASFVGRRICYETVIGELQDHIHIVVFLPISRPVHLREVNEEVAASCGRIDSLRRRCQLVRER